MNIELLISELETCKDIFRTIYKRNQYRQISCVILRRESKGNPSIDIDTFHKAFPNKRLITHYHILDDDSCYTIGFYPKSNAALSVELLDQLQDTQQAGEQAVQLLKQIPEELTKPLRTPNSKNWFRILFHLSWHYSRVNLKSNRTRIQARIETPNISTDETFYQIFGCKGSTPVLPGIITSDLDVDICLASQAAISLIIGQIKVNSYIIDDQTTRPGKLSSEQEIRLDSLRSKFQNTVHMSEHLKLMIVKVANSYETPPINEWPIRDFDLHRDRSCVLSKLNSDQELCFVNGPASAWFVRLCEQASNILPAWIPNRPILFKNETNGRSTFPPVTNRENWGRWIGFVFDTIKTHSPELIAIEWIPNNTHHLVGFARLNIDPMSASALALDLAQLTSASKRDFQLKCETCSPFTSPDTEELGFIVEGYSVPIGQLPEITYDSLIQQIRNFGNVYTEEQRRINQITSPARKYDEVCLGQFVSELRHNLFRTPGFEEARNYIINELKQDVCHDSLSKLMNLISSQTKLTTESIGQKHLTTLSVLFNHPTEKWSDLTPLIDPQSRSLLQADTPAKQEIRTRTRIFIDDIDSFKEVRNVEPDRVSCYLKNGRLDCSEDKVQTALEKILSVTTHQKDWGGEINDLYTSNVIINGKRTQAAFMLKGNGLKSDTMTIKNCGANGDQIIRLFSTTAELFVVQFIGNIDQNVIAHVESEVLRKRSTTPSAIYLIIDGQDTARLMLAYGHLDT
jgi:hypothetical protein